MAGFRTHITTSTALGIAYGGAAAIAFDVPWTTSVLAAGLCGVSGMLPDLDSGPGRPLKESLAFAAAVVPILMIDRARHMGLTPEGMALAGGALYLVIRFGLAWLLQYYTVHRGMFHSIPAAMIAGELAFLICASGNFTMRMFKAGAVVLGFLSHLILDEIYSVEWKRGRWQLKKSSGTAFKIWGGDFWPNVSTYALLGVLTLLMLYDPIWDSVSPTGHELHEVATRLIDRAKEGIDEAAPKKQQEQPPKKAEQKPNPPRKSRVRR